jgi:hypothetical protein
MEKVKIKVGAKVQHRGTGQWIEVKREVVAPVVDFRNGIYTVVIQKKQFSVDYKHVEVVD